MAWPLDKINPPEAGAIAGVVGSPHRNRRRPTHSYVVNPAPWRGRHTVAMRGLYRIFNDAEYRFYRSNVAPPVESDTPYATNPTLPFEPTDTFADGTWWLSVSRFNGIIDSGFRPVGPAGETFLRLDVASGNETLSPPNGPTDWWLNLKPNGLVEVVGHYRQDDALRADEWVINWTTGVSTPSEDVARSSAKIRVSGLSVLGFVGMGTGHGTQVNVRLQTRRNDGTDASPVWVYSEGSVVKTVFNDAQGPSVPLGGGYWPGSVGEVS